MKVLNLLVVDINLTQPEMYAYASVAEFCLHGYKNAAKTTKVPAKAIVIYAGSPGAAEGAAMGAAVVGERDRKKMIG